MRWQSPGYDRVNGLEPWGSTALAARSSISPKWTGIYRLLDRDTQTKSNRGWTFQILKDIEWKKIDILCELCDYCGRTRLLNGLLIKDYGRQCDFAIRQSCISIRRKK